MAVARAGTTGAGHRKGKGMAQGRREQARVKDVQQNPSGFRFRTGESFTRCRRESQRHRAHGGPPRGPGSARRLSCDTEQAAGAHTRPPLDLFQRNHDRHGPSRHSYSPSAPPCSQFKSRAETRALGIREPAFESRSPILQQPRRRQAGERVFFLQAPRRATHQPQVRERAGARARLSTGSITNWAAQGRSHRDGPAAFAEPAWIVDTMGVATTRSTTAHRGRPELFEEEERAARGERGRLRSVASRRAGPGTSSRKEIMKGSRTKMHLCAPMAPPPNVCPAERPVSMRARSPEPRRRHRQGPHARGSNGRCDGGGADGTCVAPPLQAERGERHGGISRRLYRESGPNHLFSEALGGVGRHDRARVPHGKARSSASLEPSSSSTGSRARAPRNESA